MAENKLTDKSLRALKPTDREQSVGDGGGLWIRVLPAAKGGTVNFYYRFQINDKERRYNCGSYPDTSLADARRKRNTARELVEQGIDPVEQAAEAKASTQAALAAQRLEKTVDGLFEDWERVYLSAHHKDNGAFARAAYELDVKPTIGAMRAREVRLPHIIRVIDGMLERGVRRKANMVLSQMRQMFRHGLGRGIVDTDPTLGISKKQAGGKETPVERNLSETEIVELHCKLNQSGLHPRMMAALRLILATGTRVGEMTNARWSDLDLTKNTWHIPTENAKNGREHLIHLSDFALEQISTLAEYRSNSYLLAGARTKVTATGSKPDSPLSEKTITKAVHDRIRSVALKGRTQSTGVLMLTGGEWTPHDLRRTMASRMGDLGVAPHVIERCLNHIQQGIVAVYQRQEYLVERQAAFELWGHTLTSLMESTIKTAVAQQPLKPKTTS
jgi:integrase